MSKQRMNEWIGEKKNHTYNFLHLNKIPIVALIVKNVVKLKKQNLRKPIYPSAILLSMKWNLIVVYSEFPSWLIMLKII